MLRFSPDANHYAQHSREPGPNCQWHCVASPAHILPAHQDDRQTVKEKQTTGQNREYEANSRTAGQYERCASEEAGKDYEKGHFPGRPYDKQVPDTKRRE